MARILGFLAFIYLVLYIGQSNRAQEASQLQGVKNIIASIRNEEDRQEAKIDRQTRTINGQFHALCVVLIETSGQQGLQQLDPTTKERCRQSLGKARQGSSSTDAAVTPSIKSSSTPRTSASKPSQVSSPANTASNGGSTSTGQNTPPTATQNPIGRALGLPDLVIPDRRTNARKWLNGIFGRR